jgi:hypothetical protein
MLTERLDLVVIGLQMFQTRVCVDRARKKSMSMWDDDYGGVGVSAAIMLFSVARAPGRFTALTANWLNDLRVGFAYRFPCSPTEEG